jgi:hypothetical protein
VRHLFNDYQALWQQERSQELCASNKLGNRMPHKPKINFSEGVLQKMAQYATKEITEAEMISWLYGQGTENPELFLKEREPLFSAIRAVIKRHQDGPVAGED